MSAPMASARVQHRPRPPTPAVAAGERDPQFRLNGRFATRAQPTGVDRLAIETTARTSVGAIIEPSMSGMAITNLWEQLVLPARAGDDTLVSLANSGPVVARRHVVAIHDTAHWDHPEWFSRPYRTKARLLNRAWARTASHLLCPSKTVAANITRWLGRDAADITVVGNGHRWQDPPPETTPERRPFVLAAGTISTRKNLAALLAAWPQVRRERPDLTLRIVGAGGGHHFSGSSDRGDDPSIEFLGYVSDETLDRLFVEATSFVSPSLYEGFNIPVLDALTAGTPVAASDIDVHRELFDGACSFADPADDGALAAAVLRASESTVATETRDELRRTHSWSAVVERIERAVDGVQRGN